MRILITGISGFAGRHLVAALQAGGHEVFGVSRRELPPSVLPLPESHLSVCDIQESAAVATVVRQRQPDGIFHLAAITNVPASFDDPERTYRTNFFGSLNVFAAVHTAAPRCRIVWVGSSDTYGPVAADELPIDENQVFRPLNPYAVSKAAADLAAFQWARAHGLDVVRLRPFNHTGPGQASEFVCAAFARQIVAVERGVQTHISAGNLDVTRDFSDVRDIVRAYVLALEHGVAGEAYNVCSGQGRSIRSVLDTLMQLAGSRAPITSAPQRQRRLDIPAVVGDAAKLRAATGWQPTYAWEQTLRDLLADWRRRGVL